MTTPEDNLQQHLRQLPDAPLPDALWQRVNGARLRIRRRRHAGIAAAALAVAALAILPPLIAPPAPDAPDMHPSLAAAPAEPADVVAELRALDRALQAGYARNASDAELEALWNQRRRLLSDNDTPPKTRSPGSLRI